MVSNEYFQVSASKLVIALSLVAGAGFSQAMGQCVAHEEHKLTPSDGDAPGFFGDSVSVDGAWTAVGRYRVPWDEPPIVGAVYMYRFDGTGWVERQRITASDASVGDRFGNSVSLSGTVLVVGAPNSEGAAAYVFRYNGSQWVEEQKLTSSDGPSDDHFGLSVSLDENRILIGAQGAGGVADDGEGAAYVFRFDGSRWVEETKLFASDGSILDGFGYTVDLSGPCAIIGAWQDDHPTGGSGSAYVFRLERGQWFEEQKLVPAERVNLFGVAVAIDQDVAIVASNYAHASFVFRHDGMQWVEEQTLPTRTYGHFGDAVALDGDRAVVASGGIFLYRHDGNQWIRVQEIAPSDASSSSHARFASISGDIVMVGVGEGASDHVGAAYAFRHRDLALGASLTTAKEGDPLSITTCGGSTLGLLAVVGLNGAPRFQPLSLGRFDGEGQWELTTVVPPGLAGLDVELQSFAVLGLSTVGESNSIQILLR